MNDDVMSKLESVEDLFAAQLDSDAGMMGAGLGVILRDEQLKAALKAKDRESLLRLARPLFEELRSEHRITHFYFTGPDRINILRVHKPEKHGDKINRFTTLQAENTGKQSYGIELGPLGTFTLRVVEPWYHAEQLIGYVELGEEIEHIVDKVEKILGVVIYIFIEKKYLNRENWKAGMQMLGRQAEWDRFPSAVMIYQGMETFPECLAELLPEEQHTSKSTCTNASLNDRRYHGRFIHLKDAGGRPVGDMVVMDDVTGLTENLYTTIFFVGGVCVTVGGALFILFYMFMGRVERQLKTANQEIVRISNAVESASDAILLTDTTGRPVYYNKTFFELSGYRMDDLNKVGGLSILSSDRAVGQEVLNSITKGIPWAGEVEMQTRSGRKVPVLLRADAIKEKTGEILGLICIYVDITERKRVEEQRIEREKLEGVIEMAGAVCHELNQPMQAVSGFSELLLADTSEDITLNGNLKGIKDQIHRMGEITKKLMRITKYETKDYVFDGKKIIDIDRASEGANSLG